MNLIGDHTDYHDGIALPMAIDRDCLAACSGGPDDDLRVHTADGDDAMLAPFADAARRVLAERDHPTVGVLAVASTVPIGAGLASSGALCVAIAGAFDPQLLVEPMELARTARELEAGATGVPCGLMDQLASAAGVAGHALRIDFERSTVDPIAIPQAIGIVVVHSGLPRVLAAGPYAERRRSSTAVARRLGLRSLRHARPDQVADEPLARHVVSENERVDAAAEALRAGDATTLGALMSASHASLRDDYSVSTPELDRLVELLVHEGAWGARLTGAGFGGCVIGVAAPERLAAIGTQVAARYASETGLTPSVFLPRAADGAGALAWG